MCSSEDYTDTIRQEHCNRCGYDVYYGDAYARDGNARISKINGIPIGGELSVTVTMKPKPEVEIPTAKWVDTWNSKVNVNHLFIQYYDREERLNYYLDSRYRRYHIELHIRGCYTTKMPGEFKWKMVEVDFPIVEMMPVYIVVCRFDVSDEHHVAYNKWEIVGVYKNAVKAEDVRVSTMMGKSSTGQPVSRCDIYMKVVENMSL